MWFSQTYFWRTYYAFLSNNIFFFISKIICFGVIVFIKYRIDYLGLSCMVDNPWYPSGFYYERHPIFFEKYAIFMYFFIKYVFEFLIVFAFFISFLGRVFVKISNFITKLIILVTVIYIGSNAIYVFENYGLMIGNKSDVNGINYMILNYIFDVIFIYLSLTLSFVMHKFKIYLG